MKNEISLIGISGKIGSGKDTIGLIIQYLTDAYAKHDNLDYESWLYEYVNIQDGYNKSGSGWLIKKFAGKTKQIVSLLTGIPVEDLEKLEVKNRVLGSEWTIPRVPREFRGTKEEWFDFADSQKETLRELNPIDIYMGNNVYKISYFKDRTLTVREMLQLVGTDAIRNVIHPNAWVNSLFVDYKPIDRRTIQDPDDSNISLPNWIITDVRFPNELKAIKDRGGIVIRVNRIHSFMENKAEAMKAGDYIVHPSETALDNAEFDYVISNDSTVDDLIVKVKEILIKEGII